MPPTHQVTNQAPPLVNHDVAADPAPLDGLHRYGAAWVTDELHALGVLAGTEQSQEWGRLVEENHPVLRTHDRYGHRIDEVEYHHHYRPLMQVAVGNGLHAAP